MQYSSNIELRQLEQGLEQIVDQHQERLERWVAPVAKHVKKYGLPIMYVGHVDLAFNHEYTPGKIIWESRKLPIEQRADFLRKRSDELSNAFPDVLLALFRHPRGYDPDIIVTDARCIEVPLIESYNVCPIRKDYGQGYVHSIITIKSYAKYSSRISSAYVSFSNEEDEQEAVCILEYAINGKEFDYPSKIIDSSKVKKYTPDAHPSFFSNSLLRTSKEMGERLAYQGFKESFIGIEKEIAGVIFSFDFSVGKETKLINSIHGFSDTIEGYEEGRRVFDAIVEMLKNEFGPWGLKLTDIPAGTRKNSIMKGLREGDFNISAKYTWRHVDVEPSYVMVDLWCSGGQKMRIHYTLIDSLNERDSELAHKQALAEAKLRREQNKSKTRKRRRSDDY